MSRDGGLTSAKWRCAKLVVKLRQTSYGLPFSYTFSIGTRAFARVASVTTLPTSATDDTRASDPTLETVATGTATLPGHQSVYL